MNNLGKIVLMMKIQNSSTSTIMCLLFLNCYVVAGKIDEMKFDKIMDYINEKLNLFEDEYK